MDYSYKNKRKNEYIENKPIGKRYNNKNKQKILKDFLIPLIQEQNKRQFLYYYRGCINKYLQKNNNSNTLRKNNSNNKTILEYSFLTYREKLIENKIKQIRLKYLNKRINSNNNKKQNKNISSKNSKSHKKITSSNSSIKNIKNNNPQNYRNANLSMKKNKSLTGNLNIKMVNININNHKRNKEENIYDNNEKYLTRNKKKNALNSLENKPFLTKRESMGFEKWYNYGKEWEKIKEIKRNIMSLEMEEKKNEMLDEERLEQTFRPKINRKSVEIVKSNFPKDFYDRLIEFEKKKKINNKKIYKKYTPLFKPNLYISHKL